MRSKTHFSLLLWLIFVPFLLSCSQDNESSQAPSMAPLHAAVGLQAPDFTLQDVNGKSWKLSDFRGNVVFINFWATWCPPCREEMPSMERLKQSMENSNFVMVSVLSNDDLPKATNFVKKLGGTFPVLDDPDSSVGRAYGLTGVPETYIVDPTGILREKFLGPRVWDSPWGKGLIKQYLP